MMASAIMSFPSSPHSLDLTVELHISCMYKTRTETTHKIKQMATPCPAEHSFLQMVCMIHSCTAHTKLVSYKERISAEQKPSHWHIACQQDEVLTTCACGGLCHRHRGRWFWRSQQAALHRKLPEWCDAGSPGPPCSKARTPSHGMAAVPAIQHAGSAINADTAGLQKGRNLDHQHELLLQVLLSRRASGV